VVKAICSGHRSHGRCIVPHDVEKLRKIHGSDENCDQYSRADPQDDCRSPGQPSYNAGQELPSCHLRLGSGASLSHVVTSHCPFRRPRLSAVTHMPQRVTLHSKPSSKRILDPPGRSSVESAGVLLRGKQRACRGGFQTRPPSAHTAREIFSEASALRGPIVRDLSANAIQRFLVTFGILPACSSWSAPVAPGRVGNPPLQEPQSVRNFATPAGRRMSNPLH
jgi:hypothetical protein